MQQAFNISDDSEVRLWNKYMSNTYEHLNRSDLTIQDAGLYQGTVRCYGSSNIRSLKINGCIIWGKYMLVKEL